jgi:hypothetical protein
MTEDVECTTEPYRPNGANRPRQARVTSDAAKVKDGGKGPAGFKTVDAFCAEYMPVSYAVEPFVRSGSLYTLTARTGAGKTALFIIMALAVATGRTELLGREVEKGRVVYIAAENPDDLRMRIMVAAHALSVDLSDLGDRFVVLDKRMKPEALRAQLKELASNDRISLIMVDTLAAFFDGDNINDPVQGGEFMRRLRPLTRINGSPPVVVAAHPKKNAKDYELVPYGAGATLNEVDGNLTLRKVLSGVTELHWQGKLRGVEFEPVKFRFDLLTSPNVKDVKHREVQLPVLRPMAEADSERREGAEIDRDASVLRAMMDEPEGSFTTWATATGIHRSSVERIVKRLTAPGKGKLTKKVKGKWNLTEAGRDDIEGRICQEGAHTQASRLSQRDGARNEAPGKAPKSDRLTRDDA